MTRDTVRARQAAQDPNPVQLLRVTIVTTSPLTVRLPGGAVVAGLSVTGLTYSVGGAGFVLFQEPAVGPVFPTT